MRQSSQRRQGGMTALGFLILVAFVGLFIYAAIRLLPVYLEYFNVVRAMEGIKADAEGGASAMRNALEKRFDIEDIKSLTYKDIEIRKDGGGWVLHAAYDAEAPYIGNVGLVVHFDKTVTLSGSAGP
ncbi:MAG: DUF4845 domain-containing protein [Proteobacteria bacterium]|nr:DUF4845 domain-containing protein [Pseudomonadota bacterium]